MDYEIHIYLGTACIAQGSQHNNPVGEKHPILFYLRENKDSEYNDSKAKQIVTNLALDKVDFTKVGKLSLDRLKTDEQKRNYESAMKIGICPSFICRARHIISRIIIESIDKEHFKLKEQLFLKTTALF